MAVKHTILMNDERESQNLQMNDDETRIAPGQQASQNKPTASLRIGDKFNDHFAIEGIIGEGGVGRVFLGYDEKIGRRVAIKELRDSDAVVHDQELIQTFIHEAKITGKLEHPGIIPVYELGQRHNKPYYVMRYVRGVTLEASLKNCRQYPPHLQLVQRLKLLDILIDVCETVAYAHSKDVIHRDLKPANIISGSFGETIILDWGIAQVLADTENAYFYREVFAHQHNTLNDTLSTEALGTPCYMAPEQFEGSADKTSDVYSLGVILYRIITGKLPYSGSFEVIQQQVVDDKPVPSPDRLEKTAPPELVAICNKALQKDSDFRFADAKGMADQLKAFREGRIVNIYAYSRKELLHRFIARNKIQVLLLCALFLAVVAGAGLSLHYAMNMEKAKIEAENSLVTITSFSETSQKQSQIIAAAVKQGASQLISDLNQAAQLLAKMDSFENNAANAVLSNLHGFYPKFDQFSVKATKSISSVSSSSWKSSHQEFMAPMAEIKDEQLRLIFRVPIDHNGRIDYFLEAELRPEVVLPDLFPMMSDSPEHVRDIWIMAEDGLIIYDSNRRYLGSNLFLEPSNQKFPSLLAFGRLSLTDDEGIGYYSFIEGQQEIYKIAAWEKVSFNPQKSWVVIVNYNYMSKKIS